MSLMVVLLSAVALVGGGTQAPRGVPNWPWYQLARCEHGIYGSDRREPAWSYDGRSGFDGGYQFTPGTWSSSKPSGYPRYAHQATPWQQTVVARRVLAAQGWGAWPTCSRKLGLR